MWDAQSYTPRSARDCTQSQKYFPGDYSLYRSNAAVQTDYNDDGSLTGNICTSKVVLPSINEKQTPGAETDRTPMTEYKAMKQARFEQSENLRRAPPAGRSNPYNAFHRSATEDFSGIRPYMNQELFKEPQVHQIGGRAGAPWRHIRQCTGSVGQNICFVDDMRQNDNRTSQSRNGRLGSWNHVVQTTGNRGEHITFINPSTGPVLNMQEFDVNNNSSNIEPYVDPPITSRTTGGYTRMRHPMLRPPGFVGGPNCATPRANSTLDTSFNNRAKKNFKYWHEEVPYQGLPAKQTITGRLMAKGIGY